MDTSLIERLARLRGIGDAYHDYRGELKYFSLDTKLRILRAMGCPVDDAARLASELDRLESCRSSRSLPPLAAGSGPRIGVDINVGANQIGAALAWSVELEDGSRREGVTPTADCRELWSGDIAGARITRLHFVVPVDLPMGYHELQLTMAGGLPERCRLIISPPHCFEPAPIKAGRRLWGIAVQLYTLRSRDNWGIGDFNDLELLIRWLARCGAAFIGLNPLHALSPADPDRSSPYSASSRHFLNVLYISVPRVAEFEDCAAARDKLAAPATAQRLRELRALDLVDYRGVAELKLAILELLYRDFCGRHLARRSGRARKFRAFVANGGMQLKMHARFDALDRHFCASLGSASGWSNWPKEFQDPNGAAAARFAAENRDQVQFFCYLQWLAHEQLASAQSLTRELGMPVGLYGDYAVGANPSGSETWADQESYRMGAEIGAPPDLLALKGQGWGIPPQDPSLMLAQCLRGFARLIRSNMRHYGALRLDHVMSLFRLWWIPADCPPSAGAYVHYPLQQLLSVLSLESARSACLVVGEDLGVVPDEVRRAMTEFGLYHYKVLLFEKSDGRFRRPDEYVERALATVTTHDMPTLRSFWEGRDVELRRRLNLYPSAAMAAEVLGQREQDRESLLAALREQGLSPATPEPFSADLAQALHLYLARTRTILVALQIEDLLGMVDPVNVPGTDREYPNWQRKIGSDIEDMAASREIAAYLAAIHQARD